MEGKKSVYIGTVLKQLRKEKNMSQEELASRSSIDPTFISLLERNIKGPGLGTIFALAAALDMKGSDFVLEIEKERLSI